MDPTLPFYDPTRRPVPDEVQERLYQVGLQWKDKAGSEEQTSQQFLLDVLRALDLPVPRDGTIPEEAFTFEKRLSLKDSDHDGKIDLYRQGFYVLESKRGRDKHQPGSQHVRGSNTYASYIMRAYEEQAKVYAYSLDEGPPPLVIVCDVGHQFWIGRRVGDRGYTPFASPETLRVPVARMHEEEFARILLSAFSAPHELDPSRYQTRITRTVAEKLAKVAGPLQHRYDPERAARFLIRCLFCMFAEDVSLLPTGIFQKMVKGCLAYPERFKGQCEHLFEAMRTGGTLFGVDEPIRRFNGALFDSAEALDLSSEDLHRLLDACKQNWGKVDPSIFGTLIEQALDEKERRKLGAHYTPRAFVERLVRPAVYDPLVERFHVEVEAPVRSLLREAEAAEEGIALARVEDGGLSAREEERARRTAREAREQARSILTDFLAEICSLKVLDPACGTANFLYVTYALLKDLEAQVRALLLEVDDGEEQLGLAHGATGIGTVAPSQFLGIEVDGFAAEIAQVVLWIGHLQWEIVVRQDMGHLPEPIIPTLRTIEHRDALLDLGPETPRLDDDGRPVTTWIRGEFVDADTHDGAIPDADARVAVVDYPEATPAEWPRADFIVGNPPFLGNKHMRTYLGDGYVDALRRAYDDVPDTVDYVMYWWDVAAQKLRDGEIRGFGFVTTNSIKQTQNRQVTERYLRGKKPIRLIFAIPDHPWSDAKSSADVRIAMTAAGPMPEGDAPPVMLSLVTDESGGLDDLVVRPRSVGAVHPDLTAGADVTSCVPLLANADVSFQGMNLVGKGFRITRDQVRGLGFDPDDLPPVIKPYLNAREMMQKRKDRFVIDAFGLTDTQLRDQYPTCWQWLYERVKPERDQNRDAQRRRDWWLFGRSNESLRTAIRVLPRFLITPETSKHRVVTWAPAGTIPDHTIYAIAMDTDWALGVLQSTPARLFAWRSGGRLGVGNDPRFNNTRCFLPFPFPEANEEQQAAIGDAARQVHAFREAAKDRYDGLGFTDMYNLMDKVRSGESLSRTEQARHEALGTRALIDLHDRLDAAVFDAYGWPHDLSEDAILERLVALNHERAEEESRGVVHWLRPDRARDVEAGDADDAVEKIRRKSATRWPSDKDPSAQNRAVFDALGAIGEPVSPGDLSSRFKGGRNRQQRIEAILEQFEAMGLVARGGDGRVRRLS